MKPTIFVIDVGAPHKENLGWANADGETGADKPEKSGHEVDALAAAKAYGEGQFYEEGSDVLNLAAAALQWAGYEADVRSAVYVVKT